MKTFIKLLVTVGFVSAIIVYYIVKSNNLSHSEPYYLTIKETTPAIEIIKKLKQDGVIKNELTFDMVLFFKTFKNVPRGRYKLQTPLGNYELISKLRNGYQDPIQLTLSTATFIEDIGGKIGHKLNFDSVQFINFILSDSILSKYQLTKDNVLCHFLPNTYEVYWSISIPQLMQKLDAENKRFWTESNLFKAKKLGLNSNEVYILASLVQKEYSKKDERSKIAAVLLNRLNIKMPLQVDATCKYATRDFGAKRVTQFHTQCNSSFNTYKNNGLPPGPICIPEISTIEAVLNPDSHNYLYYCADPSLNGYHIFSNSLSEHEQVATKYHAKMNHLNIK